MSDHKFKKPSKHVKNSINKKTKRKQKKSQNRINRQHSKKTLKDYTKYLNNLVKVKYMTHSKEKEIYIHDVDIQIAMAMIFITLNFGLKKTKNLMRSHNLAKLIPGLNSKLEELDSLQNIQKKTMKKIYEEKVNENMNKPDYMVPSTMPEHFYLEMGWTPPSTLGNIMNNTDKTSIIPINNTRSYKSTIQSKSKPQHLTSEIYRQTLGVYSGISNTNYGLNNKKGKSKSKSPKSIRFMHPLVKNLKKGKITINTHSNTGLEELN